MTLPNCARPFSNLYLSRESGASSPAVIHWPASHSHLGAVQFGWTALTVWTVQTHSASCVAAALGFIMEAVQGCREEGGIIHSFSQPLIFQSKKPLAVSCRLLLPYHNGMTNGAVKVLEVHWPSSRLSVLHRLQWSTVQLNKLCIADEIDVKNSNRFFKSGTCQLIFPLPLA